MKQKRYDYKSLKQYKLGLFALLLGGIYMAVNRTFKYFKYNEFADKISGANKMRPATIRKLDKAREIAGVPFIINSGYRDKNHPESIKNPTSSHIKGYAVDIAVNDSNRDIIQSALRQAGFNRIGLANSFIHADDDPDKTQYVTWFYDGKAPLYNQTQEVYYV